MNTGEWEDDFSEARRRLLQSSDLRLLRSRGHVLKHGAVLTSVINVPFEMSLKCVNCRATFWFENSAWSSGGVAPWHLSNISLEAAAIPCHAVS